MDLNGGTVIIEVNEAIYVENNDTSLLSTFQAREYGTIINDTAIRHGGTQNILGDGYDLPLTVNRGLLTMDIRLPTEYERVHCARIILTGDQVWDVGNYDSDANSIEYASTVLVPNLPILHEVLTLPRPREDTMCQLVRANPLNTKVREVDLLTYQARMG